MLRLHWHLFKPLTVIKFKKIMILRELEQREWGVSGRHFARLFEVNSYLIWVCCILNRFAKWNVRFYLFYDLYVVVYSQHLYFGFQVKSGWNEIEHTKNWPHVNDKYDGISVTALTYYKHIYSGNLRDLFFICCFLARQKLLWPDRSFEV